MHDTATPSPALGPGFPDEFYSWGLRVELQLKMWAGTGLSTANYEANAVDTIEAGARRLFSPENFDEWPIYSLRTRFPVTPVYRVNPTRPLWRRTSEEILEPRGAVTGPSGAPFDQIMDDTVMAIWYEGRRAAWSTEWYAYWPPQHRCAMLRVGGRNAEDADRIWDHCAKVIRPIYREVTGWGQGKRSSTSKRSLDGI